MDQSQSVVDNAVAEGGAYEVIRKRLVDQGQQLEDKTRRLNEARLSEFGSTKMSVTSRTRVRTENNCMARDIVQVGDHILFGYNVFIGLKRETKVEDVFSLIRVSGNLDEMEPVPVEGTFLAEPRFRNDFDELYRYYNQTRLIELTIKNNRLLAGFQIGEKLEDIRVFRWSVSADGEQVEYLDNRGERDIQLPPSFDFEWIETKREDIVHGRYPHINILDTVFVETTGGDLTIKVENNTEDGLGVFREPVEDLTQSLDDADVFYAKVGDLVLLRILPYREEQWRHLIYNTLTEEVVRIDAVGESCVQLPEDHGVIFPGGYYLQTGEHKTFDKPVGDLRFKRTIRSPNGEDVLFIFYQREEGVVGLFAYNMIEKALQNPIYGHGYALSDAGQIVIFSAEGEPTRVHPMQIWETPYVSDEFASRQPSTQSFFGRIGNADLVRGISDLYSVCRIVKNQDVSVRVYEDLSQTAKKMFDDHYWIAESETDGLDTVLKDIADTSELVIDEYEKVSSIRQHSAKTMTEAETAQQEIMRQVRGENLETAEDYVDGLTTLRRQRGHLTTIREFRYIDLERIDQLDQTLSEVEIGLGGQTVEFLSGEQALVPYLTKLESLNEEVHGAQTIAELTPRIEAIEGIASGLDLLTELMATIKVDDATVHTQIIDAISEVYSRVNQSRARATHKQKNLGSEEAVAAFGAQFKLLSQSITNALGMSATPEACDEQLARLLVQLEELEGQFGDYEQFLADVMEKREEIYESFESHKQQLLDERQRKAQSVADAADRILTSIEKRSLKFTEADDLNTYMASDALALKTRELAEQLREIDAAVKADDVEARFKAIREQALRSLRDKTDLFESGGNIIKLGPRHRFSVNTQELDLTIIPRGDVLFLHLTGTEFYEEIDHPDLADSREYWNMSLDSESAEVYRGEYLASLILAAAETQGNAFSLETLRGALNDDPELNGIARDFAAPRYKEGYERGIHDHDAVLILKALIPTLDRADLLRFDPTSRGLAQVFWVNLEKSTTAINADAPHKAWIDRAQSAAQMQTVFSSSQASTLLGEEIEASLKAFLVKHPIEVSELDVRRAGAYLVAELGRDHLDFIASKYAVQLVEALKSTLDNATWKKYQAALRRIEGRAAERWRLTTAWLEALVEEKDLDSLRRYIPEAVAIINSEKRLSRRSTEVDLEISIPGLLGEHITIADRTLSFSVDSFLGRMERHQTEVVPAYHHYLQTRQAVINEHRRHLRLEEFKPKPLSSFVRNRLINEAYLPIIGDNLAKQMGTVGDDKRTDLMGLLMMISPPGYGKTTLMEYTASRLGLIFMKINCPALGHEVLSLDPAQAPNATAEQELEKLNLSFEMGNNVMLYLDDIQHTHPEFLQKFISLCDGTRRIEGVWKKDAKTYDMRGRKFCVIMAGNPYTESGEAFKVPDMLANRADIYNLGDILGGMDEQFALSYIENALTSNPALAPLALREMEDVYKLVDMSKGESVATTDLSHPYSGAEVNEITEVLRKLFVLQEVVLKVNQQYIASAAQDDKYRTEPSFKLQGSYRNMNKMAEKISAVMNESELMQLIADHYLGEAQLLTTGAEENLLKLAALRGNMTTEQSERWNAIIKDFLRNKAIGGDESDVGSKVVAQLVDLVDGVQHLSAVAQTTSTEEKEPKPTPALEGLTKTVEALTTLMAEKETKVEVVNQPVPGMNKVLTVLAETMEHSIFPLVRHMDKKLEIDLGTYNKIKEIAEELRELKTDVDVLGTESKASSAKLSALTRKPRAAKSPGKT